MSFKKKKAQSAIEKATLSTIRPAIESDPIDKAPLVQAEPAGADDLLRLADDETSPKGYDQLVVFTLDGELYGLVIDQVESIIKVQAITVIPRAKPYVLGVTNLRGTVLPVVNLRKRLGLKEKSNLTDPRIVVVTVKNEKVGILVDAVLEVLRIPLAVIEPPPPLLVTIDTTFITGIARQDDKLVILLNLEQILG